MRVPGGMVTGITGGKTAVNHCAGAGGAGAFRLGEWRLMCNLHRPPCEAKTTLPLALLFSRRALCHGRMFTLCAEYYCRMDD